VGFISTSAESQVNGERHRIVQQWSVSSRYIREQVLP